MTLLLLPLVIAACGTDVTGPSASLLSCVFTDPRALDVGEVLQVEGVESRSVCLTAADAGDYLFIPFYGAVPPEDDERGDPVEIRLFGAGLGPPPAVADGAPAGASAERLEPGPRLALDPAFERRLREREVAELAPRLRPGPTGRSAADANDAKNAGTAGRAPAPAAVPPVGTLLDFNVAISCSESDLRTGRVEHVSEHAIVVADTANPVPLSPTDYAFFGTTMDTLVYPVSTAHFGEPSDIDGNGRSIIFITSAVNQLSEADAETITAGFFWSGDIFPRDDRPRIEGCAAANEAEMFYVVAPDPLGTVGPRVGLDEIRDLTVRVIGHEYQHLVNASRRLWINDSVVFESPWLNEGLSHVAEELLFYAVSGLEPGRDLDVAAIRDAPSGVWAFNRYAAGNFSNFARYLARPDTASLMGVTNLSTRGAAWSFLRYAADRSGRGDAAFLYDVANATTEGLENLDAVLGGAGTALQWMQDWTVSVYADNRVESTDERYQQGAWNLRDIYRETLGDYPLALSPLESGAPLDLDLLPGGAAFPVFSLEGGSRAAIHVEADGGRPTRAVRGSFIRIR